MGGCKGCKQKRKKFFDNIMAEKKKGFETDDTIVDNRTPRQKRIAERNERVAARSARIKRRNLRAQGKNN